jgi:hypothetical protein
MSKNLEKKIKKFLKIKLKMKACMLHGKEFLIKRT